MKCVKCGSNRVAPIMYGMPFFDEELEQALKDEKIYLGGCCLSGADPKYHCFKCKKDFGTPPMLISRQGQEDYRNIVTAIEFNVGGYFGDSRSVQFYKKGNKILLTVRWEPDKNSILSLPPAQLQTLVNENKVPAGITYQRLMTAAEWEKLQNQLYCKLYIHEWKKNYTNDRMIDGEQWSLRIKLTHGRQRRYHGSNAYPPYWKKLQALLSPFFAEVGNTKL